MFADMVGYSAVAERDESLALQLLAEQRDLVRPITERLGGREIKSMADGLLFEFSSAASGVEAAVEIQRALGARNEQAPVERRIVLRIGLHLGDVVFHGSDVLGSGVNIASRLEHVADEGGICISADVARQVRGRLDVQLVSMGCPPLKNISEPIEAYKVLLEPSSETPRTPQARSIAVLPFANMSAEPDNEYFSDGLTEDILSQLSRIRALKVISRTSVMQYKNTSKNLRAIGRELSVQHVVEGSVRKVGNRVRITAQLIDAYTDEHVWADTYDRDLSDIFAVQTEVAQQIAGAMRAHVSPDEQERIHLPPTTSVEAYQLYLQGRASLNKRTREAMDHAIECFDRALQLDERYAQALAGKADSYLFLALFEHVPPRDAFPKARIALERALEIKPDLAEVRASLGLVKFQFDWDWTAAERELRKAIELNPNYATGHHYFADFLKGMGRFEEAAREIQLAQELDPLSLPISSGVGHVLYLSRRYDDALLAYRHTLELEPNFLQARLWFGRPYLQKGMFKEAVAELEAACELSGRGTMPLAVLGHAYASAGDRPKALKILEQLQKRAEEQYVPSYWIGLVYVGLDDKPSAIERLEKACEERSAWLAWIGVEPRFDPLRAEPRFQDLLRRIGFPEKGHRRTGS